MRPDRIDYEVELLRRELEAALLYALRGKALTEVSVEQVTFLCEERINAWLVKTGTPED